MKKLLIIFALLAVYATAQSQTEVTKFLGIPVDGTKSQMIKKLKAKGFEEASSILWEGALEGEFNGKDVYIAPLTNNNKVYRIGVADAQMSDETQIRIRFNTLCQQFSNNGKYIPDDSNEFIPDDEDIEYNISIKNKQYAAAFYQKSSIDGEVDYNRLVWFSIEKGSYGGYLIVIHYDNLYNQANGEDL